MNLKPLFQVISDKYGITEEQILSKSRNYDIQYCRILIIGYLVEKYNIDYYTISEYFNRDRTSIYKIIKNYNRLSLDISIFDNIELEIKPIPQDMKFIKYLIDRHNITGDLKKYLLNYEEII